MTLEEEMRKGLAPSSASKVFGTLFLTSMISPVMED